MRDKWAPEVRHYCPDTPIVVVGTKIDMRNDKAVLADLVKKGILSLLIITCFSSIPSSLFFHMLVD